jgi:hypothetical protein
MSSASSQRAQQQEVIVMFEPKRLEPLVLQTASRWGARPLRKPLRQRLVASGDAPGAPRAARERSAQ